MPKNLASTVLSAALAIGASYGSQAAVTLNVSVEGTAGMPGFATYTLSFTANEGQIGGFRGNLNADGNAFTGPLNQASSGTASDSFFNVNNTDLAGIGSVTFESTSSLGGIFTILNDARFSSIDLVQIVAPVDSSINYNFGVSEAIGASATTHNFQGNLSVTLGDANNDGLLTNGDINAFVLALTDESGYAIAFPQVDPNLIFDFNFDGQFTNGDINGFVDALTGATPNVAADLITAGLVVPEPTTLSLAGIASFLAGRRRRVA